MALRLGVDLKLFDAISSRNKINEDKPITVGQISGDVKADSKLVREFSSSQVMFPVANMIQGEL